SITSSQRARLRNARSYIRPCGWPMGQMSPKFRTEAPAARRLLSKTTTFRPRRAAAQACATPMTPAPTIARSARLSGIARPLPHGRGSERGCAAKRPFEAATVRERFVQNTPGRLQDGEINSLTGLGESPSLDSRLTRGVFGFRLQS